MKAASPAQKALIAAVADLVAETGRPATLADATTQADTYDARKTMRVCLRRGWLDQADIDSAYRWTVTVEGYAQIGREAS